MGRHTAGPWRWELNPKHRQMRLCGGVPRYDLTVMDFVRWGMGGAAPRFREPEPTRLNIMHRAEKWGAVVPGREHHEDWFRAIDHPDARLIEAAPDLLAALTRIIDAYDFPDTAGVREEIEKSREVIRKAKGEA